MTSGELVDSGHFLISQEQSPFGSLLVETWQEFSQQQVFWEILHFWQGSIAPLRKKKINAITSSATFIIVFSKILITAFEIEKFFIIIYDNYYPVCLNYWVNCYTFFGQEFPIFLNT